MEIGGESEIRIDGKKDEFINNVMKWRNYGSIIVKRVCKIVHLSTSYTLIIKRTYYLLNLSLNLPHLHRHLNTYKYSMGTFFKASLSTSMNKNYIECMAF